MMWLWIRLRFAKRVRVHLFNDKAPSVEGLLVSRRHREYAIAVPRLVATAEGEPRELGAELLLIPRENVAFVEQLSLNGGRS